MQAPTNTSYWVIPGKFLAGRTPVDPEESATRSNLLDLVDGGVDFFIDLTETGELPPYAGLAQTVAASRKGSATHARYPIPDFGISAAPEIRATLDAIDTAISGGHVVYLHCWGGKGRTGTVVGCYLVRHGLWGEEALNEIKRLRQGLPDAGDPSPETEAQRQMVLNWVE